MNHLVYFKYDIFTSQSGTQIPEIHLGYDTIGERIIN